MKCLINCILIRQLANECSQCFVYPALNQLNNAYKLKCIQNNDDRQQLSFAHNSQFIQYLSLIVMVCYRKLAIFIFFRFTYDTSCRYIVKELHMKLKGVGRQQWGFQLLKKNMTLRMTLDGRQQS